MAIAYRCTCGEPLRAADEMAGHQVKCPACEQMHTVPAATRRRKKRRDEEASGGAWPRQLTWFLGGAGLAGILLLVVLVVWGLSGRTSPPGDNVAEQNAPPFLPPAQKKDAPPDKAPAKAKPPEKNAGVPNQEGKQQPNPADGDKKDAEPKAPDKIELYTYRPPFRDGEPSKNVRIHGASVQLLGADGAIGFGREGGATHFGVLMPGSTGLQVVIDSKLGYTKAAGLRFQDPATLSLPPDGTVQADRAGVNAVDKDGVPFVSREVEVGGRKVIAMVKGRGTPVKAAEADPGARKGPKEGPGPEAGKLPPEKEPAPEPAKPVTETRRFEGHTGTVWGVAFAPDGKRALSGGEDKTLRLWEVATGKPVRVFEPLKAAVRCVVFASTGKQALSGGDDGSVVLWDVETGKPVQRFEGHTGPVFSVAFAPNGAHAVSAGDDRVLRLWDVASGKEERRFEGHGAPVQAVAFSPGGLWLVSRSLDGTVRLWEARTGKQLQSHKGHGDTGARVCCFDGRRVLSGIDDKELRLWDVESGKELRRFQGHTDRIGAVALSLGDRRALSGGADLTLRLWDLETGNSLQTFAGHTKEIVSVAIAPNGRLALSGSADGTVRLWELPKATPGVAGTKPPDGKRAEPYLWAPPFLVNGVSKNIQVFEKGNGVFTYTGLGKNSELFVAKGPDGRDWPMPDAPGSTNIKVVVNPRLGYTTLASLRFKDNATVHIGKDGAVYVNRAGIRATHTPSDDVYVSRELTVDGRRAFAMVLVKRAF